MSSTAEEWKSLRVKTIRSGSTTHTATKRVGRSAGVVRFVDRVGEVEPLRTAGAYTLDILVRLSHPDKLLARMIEVELNLVAAGGNSLSTSELQLLDEVLMTYLSETTPLVGVKVDVINVERRRVKVEAAVELLVIAIHRPVAVLSVVELEVNLNLMVLESDKRKSETRVAAEPELKGNVESGLRDATVRARTHLCELRDVANHVRVTSLMTRSLGKLVPNVKPLTVVLVHALTTNLDFNRLDEHVANPVEPAETLARLVKWYLRKSYLKVDAVHQVTIATDGARHLLAKVGRAVEGLLNCLHTEVRMAPVNHLEKCNLRVTCEVDILGTVGH